MSGGTEVNDKPYSLSVKVAVMDAGGRCLLLKRSAKSKGNPGKWELPGGKVNSGEDFDRALVREVMEETGLSIALDRVLGAAERELPGRRIAYLIMAGSPRSGTVRLSEEHDDSAWVLPEEFKGREIVEQLKATLSVLL